MSRLNLGAITAYAIAVKHGFEGTEEEWLASLKGKDGDVIIIIVDDELSSESTNPVQNKVIKEELDKKVDKITETKGLVKLYAVGADGNPLNQPVQTSRGTVINAYIPRYQGDYETWDNEPNGGPKGYLVTNTPTRNYHAVNLKYFNDNTFRVFKHIFNIDGTSSITSIEIITTSGEQSVIDDNYNIQVKGELMSIKVVDNGMYVVYPQVTAVQGDSYTLISEVERTVLSSIFPATVVETVETVGFTGLSTTHLPQAESVEF